jgi:hypothetical protein
MNAISLLQLNLRPTELMAALSSDLTDKEAGK